MSFPGFINLSDAELSVLLAFDNYYELVVPELIHDYKGSTLRSLRNKGLVKLSSPIKLTKKGIKLINHESFTKIKGSS